MDRAANVVESEVPGAGTGVTAFTPAVVAGATADMVGDPAIGERAVSANKHNYYIYESRNQFCWEIDSDSN